MNITYFIRSKDSGFSIGKLFRPLIKEIGMDNEVYTYYVPCKRYNFYGVCKNLWYVFKHRNRKGINHITGDLHFCILALIGCKSVLTVHDLGFYIVHKDEMSFIYRNLLFLLQIYLPIRLATQVIAISPKTKSEILKYVPSAKVTLAHHVSIDKFKYSPKKFNTDYPRILQIGTTAPTKNLESSLKALAGIKCHFRIIKEMTSDQHELAQSLHIDYSNSFNLTDEEIIKEYQMADIVLFPSLYEGFGAITVEAQATGRPVITTNLEPMKSIAGNGAILLNNPLDITEIKDAIQRIIQDVPYRQTLIENGIKNAAKYTLSNCVKEHLDVYYSLNKA